MTTTAHGPASDPPQAAVEADASAAPTSSRPRLAFLDGIRGFAAVYVLFFHELRIAVPQGTEPESVPLRILWNVFGYGHFAVCVFIVLSGFSLMLPLVRSSTWQLRGGATGYLLRRAKRILPPYYAALALSIAVIVAYQSVSTGNGDGRYDAALSPGSIVSHLFLVQNFSFDWVYRINGPMWSVATEWQIYFLLPFVLIPLWRRFGAGVTLLVAWAVPLAIHFGLPDGSNYYWAAPWFVGSFTLGMWGAEIGFSDSSTAERLRRIPWSRSALVALAGIVTIIATGHADWPYPIVDGVVSLFALAWIMTCVVQVATEQAPDRRPLVRLFGSRPAAYLGGFSYSIYLLQHPLLRLSEKVLGGMPLTFDQVLVVQLVVGTPIILALSWLFAEFFERPFTGGGVVLPYLRRHLMPRRGQVDEAIA